MAEHYHYDENAIVNVETHHEKSDVNVRALLWFCLIVVVSAAVMHFMIYGLYRFFAKMENKALAAPPMTMMARPADADVPAEPRLQPFPKQDPAPYHSTPPVDMVEMRGSQDAALSSYGWVNKQTGEVHIPIEEAKRLALQRGFAVVPPPATATTSTTSAQPATQTEGTHP